MTKQTELEQSQHIANINALTPAAKTSMILRQQDEADKQLTINEDLRAQVDALLDLKDEQIKTISELRNDIQTIQARHVAEERMSSSMKSAFIAMQAKYIQLLESK